MSQKLQKSLTPGAIKVLVVGEPASIHANRFIRLLQEIGYQVRLFPVGPLYFIEEHLNNISVYSPLDSILPTLSSIKYIDNKGFEISKPYQLIRRALKKFIFKKKPWQEELKSTRALELEDAIDSWKPNLIISLKLQNEGYLACLAKKEFSNANKKFPPLLHFCWGTDLEYFGKNKDVYEVHLPLINQALGLCDYLLCDTLRDVAQARNFGFKGKNFGFMLATGGFDLPAISIRNNFKASERKVIIVKGREGGLVGHALNVVEAMKKISKELIGYQIKFIMVSKEARLGIESLSKEYQLNCEIVKRLPYADLANLFAKSLISISASSVDGTPGFLLESLAFGAFPIHSKMSSIDSWIDNGVNGLTFDVNDITALSNCILLALSDPKLINSAHKINGELALKLMDRAKIKNQLEGVIEEIIFEDLINKS